MANQGPPRREAASGVPPAWRPAQILRVDMTIAKLYRAEADRCRDRAEKASTPERVTRWRRLAEDNLRLAMELEAADGPSIAPE